MRGLLRAPPRPALLLARPRLAAPLPPPLRLAPSPVAASRAASSDAAAAAAPAAPHPPAAVRRGARIVPLLLAAALGLYATDRWLWHRVLERNLRTAWCAAKIAVDYKFVWDGSLESSHALHERCAARMLATCEANAGLYTKLAQALGSQGAVLPKPYLQLAKLLDDAERMDWEVVRKVIEKDRGASVEELFHSIDHTPLAAASIAQVHVARLKTSSGEPGAAVAVKVQRPEIIAQAGWDLLCFRLMLHVYERIFDLPMSAFGQYISQQTLNETSFVKEAANATALRKAVESDPMRLIRETVMVPRIYEELSGEQVLVMDYIPDAVKMTDIKRIEEMGLSVKEATRSVCEVFSSMIFQYGLVHADGHAGNVLVRQHPSGKKGKHQIVIIDHGLVVRLTDEFRKQYAQLWKAIYEVDMRGMNRIMSSWGIGEEGSELFASATLMRPWSGKSKEEKQRAREERRASGKSEAEVQREKMKKFLNNVELVPKELVFVGRSMRIVQANCQTVGSPVNRLNILARHAASALVSERHTTLADRVASLKFRTALLAIDVLFQSSRFLHWVVLFLKYPLGALGLRPLPAKERKRGFEDDLAAGMSEMAAEFGVEIDEDAFNG